MPRQLEIEERFIQMLVYGLHQAKSVNQLGELSDCTEFYIWSYKALWGPYFKLTVLDLF